MLSAAVSAGGAYLANRSSNKAAERAADTTAEASREANALQRYIYEQESAKAAPYLAFSQSAMGPLARLLGLNFDPGAAGAATAAATTPYSGYTPQYDYDGYLAGNPDVASWSGSLSARDRDWIAEHGYDRSGDGVIDGREAAAYHYDMHGRGEGRAIDPYAGVAGNNAQSYQAAPEGEFTPMSGDALVEYLLGRPGAAASYKAAQDASLARLAAAGLGQSGRAARAAGEIGSRFIGDLYDQEVSRLGAVVNGGQFPLSLSAQQGQNYANNTGQNLINAANTRASAYSAQGANDAGFYGFASNQLSNAIPGAVNSFQKWLG